MRRSLVAVAFTGAAATAALAQAPVPVTSTATATFVNFESGPVRPLLVNTAGNRLYALNTADGRLEVFAILNPAANAVRLQHLGSAFTGLEPVSMAFDPNRPQRIFVVNNVSDTVAAVDVSNPFFPAVEQVIQVGDEPQDVAIANGFLYVACSRAPQAPEPAGTIVPSAVDEQVVAIFSITGSSAFPTYTWVTNRLVGGHKPRALAVDAAGGTVFVIPQNSGNRTTIVTEHEARAATPQLRPLDRSYTATGASTPVFTDPVFALNPLNDFPFPVTLFGAANTGGWSLPLVGRVLTDTERMGIVPGSTALPDDDLTAISSPGNALAGTAKGVGTTLFGIAANPATGELWIACTESRNRTRFEPQLKGSAIENRVAIVDPTNLAAAPTILRLAPAAAGGVTLAHHAQPTSIAFFSGTLTTGPVTYAYVSALGTSDIVVFNAATNAVVSEFATGDIPVGMAVDPVLKRLFVLCRGDNSIRVYDIDSGHAPLLNTSGGVDRLAYDPEPMSVSRGRAHLYDARMATNHGNDSMSCASCHVFGDLDQLAWDLGDPEGGLGYYYPELQDVGHNGDPALGAPGAVLTETGFFGTPAAGVHPMKGPMVTQSLRGLAAAEPFHWRGDRRFFQMFRGAFENLLAGPEDPSSLRPALDETAMQQFTAFVKATVFPPNPFEPRDRNYVGSAALGMTRYGMGPTPGSMYNFGLPNTLCVDCHVGAFAPGGDFTGQQPLVNNDSVPQFMNTPQLRGLYDKAFKTRLGFGTDHEGGQDGLRGFLDTLQFDMINDGFNALLPATSARDEVADFLKQWDTGLSPLVGRAVAANYQMASFADVNSWLDLYESEAKAVPAAPALRVPGSIGVAVRGNFMAGSGAELPYGFAFLPDAMGNYVYIGDDDGSAPVQLSRAQLLSAITAFSGSFVFVCVPVESVERFGRDRDEDGLPDRFEQFPFGSPGPFSWPWSPDSDGDGFDDRNEFDNGGAALSAAIIPADTVKPTVTRVELRDVFNSSATVHVEVDEPATIGGSIGTITFSSGEKRRVHDIPVTGLAPAASVTAVVTATDSALLTSTPATSAAVTTAVQHFHVKSIGIVPVPGGTPAPYTVNATVSLVDQADMPVPDGVPLAAVWVGTAGGSIVFFQSAVQATLSPNPLMPTGTVTLQLAGLTPPVSSMRLSLCIFTIGSSSTASPWFVGYGNTPAAGTSPAFFYEQPANQSNYASITLP